MDERVSNEFELLFTNHPALEACRESIRSAYGQLCRCYEHDGLVMACGNGGSASDAEHIVGELMKGFKLCRPLTDGQRQQLLTAFPEEGSELAANLQQTLRAVSLVSQSAISTAFINDVQPDMVFAQQVWGYGKEGDLLIALSTSGNSKNVVNACKVAKTKGIRTIAFTGQRESKLSRLCDVAIRVPAVETYRVQEYHLPVYHALCAMAEMTFFSS